MTCCLFVTLACASTQPQAQTTAAVPPTPVRSPEVRAIWVVRTSITSPEAIEKLIADARGANINNLIVQVRGRGDAYYRSRWEPRAVALKDQPDSFDPLREVINRARPAGIKVHAWLNTHFLANLEELPPQPSHAFNTRPEWLGVPRRVAVELYSIDPADPLYRQRIIEASKQDLSELEGLYTSPAHPSVKEHVYNVFMDVLENYEVDGIHFDYVRLANPDFDFSRTALDRFRAELEPALTTEQRQLLSGLAQNRPLIYVELYPQAWDRFRRAQITELVERIYHGVKARKPHVLVSAAVFANDEDAFNRRFQDWKTWLEKGILDVLCPMAYTPDTEIWKRQIAIARGYAFGREVWAGIGAYRIPPESAIEKIRLGRRLGVDGFVLFSYNSLVSKSERAPEGDYLVRLAREVFNQ